MILIQIFLCFLVGVACSYLLQAGGPILVVIWLAFGIFLLWHDYND